MKWWERDGGATSVENGILLCNYHHHEVHRQDLTITRSSAPPRTRAPGSIAHVTYEFRDPAGRAIRQTTRERRPAERTLAEPPRSAPPVKPRGSAPPTTGMAPPVAGTAPEPPDELDFTPTTDPITGMTVPAYFAALFSAWDRPISPDAFVRSLDRIMAGAFTRPRQFFAGEASSMPQNAHLSDDG